MGLGRHIRPDIRNLDYPIHAAPALKAVDALVRPSYKFHGKAWQGDQGNTPHCVAYAFAHLIENGPITHRGKAPIIEPVDIYKGAQANDEWSGTAYDGTSALGACKWLQSQGVIGNYYWGKTLDEVLDALAIRPIPFGQSWYSDMYEPNDLGFVTPTGSFEGGHETLLMGYNEDEKYIKAQNSWSKNWGTNGFYYLTFESFEKLLADYGDVVFVEENKKFIQP